MPQRFLRPGLTTSQRFNAVSFAAQTFYVRLVTLVDDFGRYDANPRLLRSHTFPLGDSAGREIPVKTMEEMCEQLARKELAIFYRAADGKLYVQITRWQERARADKSKFPVFDNTCEQMFANDNKCSPPSPSPSPLHPRPNVIASTQLRWSQAGWEGRSADLEKELKAAYPACDIARTFLEMEQWLKANPTRAHKSNWRKFVTNWLQKKQDRGGEAATTSRNGSFQKQKIGRDPDELMSDAAWERKFGGQAR